MNPNAPVYIGLCSGRFFLNEFWDFSTHLSKQKRYKTHIAAHAKMRKQTDLPAYIQHRDLHINVHTVRS